MKIRVVQALCTSVYIIILRFKKPNWMSCLMQMSFDYTDRHDRVDRSSSETDSHSSWHLQSINIAPLKGILETDPVRSKVLKLLIDDSGWVSTTDLLRAARQVRPIVGAVTIGTILNGMNELVDSKLIMSRTSLSSGLDWAEWRINPDWIHPARKLLQMLRRPRLYIRSREDAKSANKEPLHGTERQSLLKSE